MKLYTIKFCSKIELGLLQEFLENHWRHNHVMATSKELFEFQHDYQDFDDYTFAIAVNNDTGEIDGAFGLIKYWKYDTTHMIPNAGWTAIWKTREDVHNNEIGGIAFKLLKFLLTKSNVDIFASLGISKIYKGIAEGMHFTVGEMKHYYIVNEFLTDFKIIVRPNGIKQTKNLDYVIKESGILPIDVGFLNSINPLKNYIFFRNRYECHPFFNYIFWNVYDNDKLIAIIVVRKILVIDKYIYRILDMIGTFGSEKGLYNAIQNILQKTEAEYVDCLNAGLDENLFRDLGFTKIDRAYGTIIPEHLNPLEHKYIPLEYAYVSDKPLVIFKGDGDQDRPNSQQELCRKS